ncbi:glycosyltransferase [Blastococcus mobilis]|uniref:glycosyltransferase n=1 Tax=Blastococcus mobilis TaxID=1938746 RepID=UPI001595E2FC|nr:glycosyltransferase [Blastococcus mobilis]
MAQNADAAALIRRKTNRVVVHPNVALSSHVKRNPESARLKTIGYAGHLLRLKGLGLLLDALAEPSLRAWTLELVGDGPDEQWLRDRAAALGVAERVTFLGRLPHNEVLTWLETISLFAFPSFRDSAGWALAEAVMVGVPVVALDQGGPPTITGGLGIVASRPVHSLASRLAQRIAGGGGQAPAVWSSHRFPEVIDTWYRRAVGELHQGAESTS